MLKRPTTQQLQTESFITVQSIVNSLNCEFRKTDPDNAGLDGEIELVKQGMFQGKIIKFQLKAGQSYISSQNKRAIKIKIEKKYLDIWANSNFPIILVFYHPDEKQAYWKGIKEYLKVDPNILKKASETVTIPFDRTLDKLTVSVLPIWFLMVDGKLEYEKIIYTEGQSEIVWSNWYPIIEFPKFIFRAPTSHERTGEITSQIEKYYCFILKDKHLYTFSNLENVNCELARFCDIERAEKIELTSIQVNYTIELLNALININLSRKGMLREGDRFYFDPKVLEPEGASEFHYTSVKGMNEHRVKVYRQKAGEGWELKHHAIQASFQQVGGSWYMQLEPDWYFTYRRIYKNRKEIGTRITREKAGMFNEQYRNHLHAMKQYLSDNNPTITLLCDDLDDSQKVTVSGSCISPKSSFTLYNDYSSPEKEEQSEDRENT